MKRVLCNSGQSPATTGGDIAILPLSQCHPHLLPSAADTDGPASTMGMKPTRPTAHPTHLPHAPASPVAPHSHSPNLTTVGAAREQTTCPPATYLQPLSSSLCRKLPSPRLTQPTPLIASHLRLTQSPQPIHHASAALTHLTQPSIPHTTLPESQASQLTSEHPLQ